MYSNQDTDFTTLLIHWAPDKNSCEPLYQQIANHILSLVTSGDLTVGTTLPPQRMLATLFGVNRSTIVAALEKLLALGLLETSYGGGTKIASNTWSLRMSSSTPDWGNYLHAGAFRENIKNIQTINHLEFKPGILRLGTGELSPALFPKDYMARALQNASNTISSLNYIEPLGLYELRVAIAEFLKQEEIIVSPANVLITSGSLQSLHLISIALLKKGDLCFTETPSYLNSLQVFSSAGIPLQGIPMDQEGIKYWEIPHFLKEKTTPILYTIPTFQNPTGIVTSKERRIELLHFCEKYHLPIIEDAAYRPLWLDAPPPKPLKAEDKNGLVLYLGTASKAFAPGLRVGWLIGPEAIVNRLADVKMQLDYGASSISQWMMTELLQSEKNAGYFTYLREELRTRRDHMVSLLREYFSDIARFEVPSGGFYIWLTFKNPVNINKLYSKAMEHNILLNIGSLYGAKTSSIRLSYAYASFEEMTVGIKKLREFV